MNVTCTPALLDDKKFCGLIFTVQSFVKYSTRSRSIPLIRIATLSRLKIPRDFKRVTRDDTTKSRRHDERKSFVVQQIFIALSLSCRYGIRCTEATLHFRRSGGGSGPRRGPNRAELPRIYPSSNPTLSARTEPDELTLILDLHEARPGKRVEWSAATSIGV